MSEGAQPSPAGLGELACPSQAKESWQHCLLPPEPGGAQTLAPLPTVQTEELHSIRGELSQIKAQVDHLLETVDRMDQQMDQLPGQTPPSVGPGHTLSRLRFFHS